MPKSLGKIHTANFSVDVNDSQEYHALDVSGELTKTLQTMVRQGQSFKIVGIDMTMSTQGVLGGGQIAGELRYYSPTRGRCEAYRNAFKAMMDAMKLQGINHAANAHYDFRPAFDGRTSGLINQASLNGTDGLTLGTAGNPTPTTSSVFAVHNASVEPETPSGTNLFSAGFNTMGNQNTPTDFVLNDGLLYNGNRMTAHVAPEFIPFTLSWTPDTTDLAIEFAWRPDPALFLAVLTGQFQIYINELNKDGGAPGVELNIAVHVAGWKSIMGSPDTKKRARRKKN